VDVRARAYEDAIPRRDFDDPLCVQQRAQAGPKVAAILSVVESCRRMRISARDYLAAVLPGLADRPIRCLPDLTPVVWVASIPRVCGRADELGGPGMQAAKTLDCGHSVSMTGPARCCLLVGSE
jgi:hypothetical protein